VNVYPFIEAEKAAERNVARACVLLTVSRSAFYGWHHHEAGPRAQSDAKLSGRIVQIHRGSRFTYGAPRITAALRQDGVAAGKKRVARLMRGAGLAGRSRRRKIRTTISDPGAGGAMVDRLQRAFAPGKLELDRI
jgi:putative transposase